MSFEIKITIDAPDLCDALNNIAKALSTPNVVIDNICDQPEATSTYTPETVEPETEVKPTKTRKPPKKTKKEKANDTSIAIEEKPTNVGNEIVEAFNGPECTYDNVVILAKALANFTPDNQELGTTRVRACLKAVGAKTITDCDKDQLCDIVPLLEKNLGKTFAEVLAVA